MDEVVYNAIAAVRIDDDVTQERWFATICSTYDQLAGSDQPDWSRFVSSFTEGAMLAGLDSQLVERFVEHLTANDLTPIETIGRMNEVASELPLLYRERRVEATNSSEATTDGYDETAWHATPDDAGSGQGGSQAEPQLSPDGQWWWDGSHWLPAAEGTALLGSPGHGRAGDLGDREGWPKPQQLPLGTAVGPHGAVTPGPTSSSTDDELTGFATGKAELTAEHKKVLDRIAADLNAHPLRSGGFVTLAGGTDRTGTEAANRQLGQDRADAALEYLRDLVTDDETKQAIRAYSLGEPSDGPESDDPTLRRVDIAITRRGYDVDLGPHPSQPLRKEGKIEWDFTPKEKEIRRYTHKFDRPDPRHPDWPDWFWKEVKKWPPGPSLISELSALINQTLGTHNISRIAKRIARAFHLTEAQAAEVEKTLDDAFQEGGEIAIKALVKGIIEKGVGDESDKPASRYGPTTEPVFPEHDVQPQWRF